MSHVPGLFEHIFVPSAPDGSTLNMVTTGPVAFEEMFDCHTMGVLSQRLNSDLDLFYSQIFMYSVTSLKAKIFKTFHEILCISIFPYLTLL